MEKTYYALKDVKDMGQQMGYRQHQGQGYHNLDWNWPEEAMYRPFGAG